MNTSSQPTPVPRWTMKAFWQGAWRTLPLLPGIFVFGMAVGTVAARKGFSLFETLAMSATVFAGMAQMIVLESWPETLTLPAIVGAAVIVGMVCLRFLLIGASLRPWLGKFPSSRIYPSLYLLTDTNWLVTVRYRSEGGGDPAFFLGGGVITWVTWVVAAAPGYWLGSSIGDPHRFGLDLVMPVFFVAMLVPLWRGPRPAIGWIVGGAAAVAAEYFLGGWWHVLIGAIAGSVVGGLVNERQ